MLLTIGTFPDTVQATLIGTCRRPIGEHPTVLPLAFVPG